MDPSGVRQKEHNCHIQRKRDLYRLQQIWALCCFYFERVPSSLLTYGCSVCQQLVCKWCCLAQKEVVLHFLLHCLLNSATRRCYLVLKIIPAHMTQFLKVVFGQILWRFLFHHSWLFLIQVELLRDDHGEPRAALQRRHARGDASLDHPAAALQRRHARRRAGVHHPRWRHINVPPQQETCWLKKNHSHNREWFLNIWLLKCCRRRSCNIAIAIITIIAPL